MPPPSSALTNPAHGSARFPRHPATRRKVWAQAFWYPSFYDPARLNLSDPPQKRRKRYASSHLSAKASSIFRRHSSTSSCRAVILILSYHACSRSYCREHRCASINFESLFIELSSLRPRCLLWSIILDTPPQSLPAMATSFFPALSYGEAGIEDIFQLCGDEYGNLGFPLPGTEMTGPEIVIPPLMQSQTRFLTACNVGRRVSV